MIKNWNERRGDKGKEEQDEEEEQEEEEEEIDIIIIVMKNKITKRRRTRRKITITTKNIKSIINNITTNKKKVKYVEVKKGRGRKRREEQRGTQKYPFETPPSKCFQTLSSANILQFFFSWSLNCRKHFTWFLFLL